MTPWAKLQHKPVFGFNRAESQKWFTYPAFASRLREGSDLYCPKTLNDANFQRTTLPHIHPNMGIQQYCLTDSSWNNIRMFLSLSPLITALVSYYCYNKSPTFSGFKQQHRFIILHFWKSEIWNGSHWAAFLPSALGGKLFSFLFQFLETSLIPWAMTPFLSSKPAMARCVFSGCPLSVFDSSASRFLFKSLGPTREYR